MVLILQYIFITHLNTIYLTIKNKRFIYLQFENLIIIKSLNKKLHNIVKILQLYLIVINK
jgi:hypothetical protein